MSDLPETKKPLTDSQIITKRVRARRKFLIGAAASVAGLVGSTTGASARDAKPQRDYRDTQGRGDQYKGDNDTYLGPVRKELEEMTKDSYDNPAFSGDTDRANYRRR